MSYVWTSKGYKFVEYEEADSEERSECIKCDAPLPEEPTGGGFVRYVVIDSVDFEGESVPWDRDATLEEIAAGVADKWYYDYEWKCGVCGYVHSPSEMEVWV